MNFSGIPNQGLAGRLLRLPLRLVPSHTRVRILQGHLRGKRWVAGSSTHGCWLGSYELEKQRLFQHMIEPGSVVFDIGANVGFYTLLASSLVGPRGRVVAFEPVPRNLRFLKQHLRMNRVRNTLVVEAAVSNLSGEAFFEESSNASTGRIAKVGRLRVPIVTLDDMVEQGRAPAPQYLKIDVEGAEAGVLEGARRLLNSTHPVIFLATHGDEVHRRCCDLLRTSNYRLQAIGTSSVEQADEILAVHEG